MYIILLCVVFTSFVQSHEIHKLMTHEQISDIFQTTYEEVPLHEVVSIKHVLHKRSTGHIGIQMKINGMNKNLYLKPVKGYFAGKKTKVWTAKLAPNSQNKLIYNLHTGAMENVGTLYQDKTSLSAISHRVDEEGMSRFDGFSGNHVIRSLPNHLRKRRDIFEKNATSHENVTNRTDSNDSYHVVYQRQFPPGYGSYFPGYQVFPGTSSMPYPQTSKLGKPQVIYPEVMVFVDDALFSRFNKNINKALNYVLSFWNGVDLRYRELKGPEVFLNIAGIIFIEGNLPLANRFSSPYFPTKMIAPDGLDAFAHFLHGEDKIKLKRDYDVALLMTGNDLTSRNMQSGILGIANGAGACRYDNNQIMAVGLFEDNGGYTGLSAGAHELAHLLGAPHDGEQALPGIGGPGAQRCPFAHGYMMSYRRDDTKQFHFSPCSRNAMSHFASLSMADCLRNDPSEKMGTKQSPRMLPGKLMTLDEQCKKQGYYASMHKNARVCTHLVCLVRPNSRQNVRESAAADGSYCGKGKYCLDGECVIETPELESDVNPIRPETTKPASVNPQTDAPMLKPKKPLTPKPNLPKTTVSTSVKPQTDAPILKPKKPISPNPVLSVNEQCKMSGFLKAINNDAEVCVQLMCLSETGNVHQPYVSYNIGPAFEGSVCGVNMRCLNEVCVSENDVTSNAPEVETESPIDIYDHEVTADELCQRNGALGAKKNKRQAPCMATCVYSDGFSYIYNLSLFKNGHPCSVNGATGKCQNGMCKMDNPNLPPVMG